MFPMQASRPFLAASGVRYLISISVLRSLITLSLAASPATPQKDQRSSFQVATNVVRVPVSVVDKKGHVYTDLKRENFRILEDGIPQEITNFAGGESPLTLVMLLEYSGLITYIRGEVIRPAGVFVSQILQPGDYVAMVSFDIRPHLLADFTQERYKLLDAVNQLVYSPPGFEESNLYDALAFVLQGGTLEKVDYKGLSQVAGRTGVLLVASGLDTFSKLNFGEARKIVANAGVPVYSIGIGEFAYIQSEPYLSGSQRLDFLQAQNSLRTFSDKSGGHFYSVRFEGELEDVLQSIATLLRYQFTLGYSPQNLRREGKTRKIEVLVDVDGDGEFDNKQLDLEYRKSYTEPKPQQ